MDPDAMLAEIRTFVAKWEGSAREQRPIAEYDRAIEKIRDLDALLSRGGRPPAAWARHAADRPTGRNPRPIF